MPKFDAHVLMQRQILKAKMLAVKIAQQVQKGMGKGLAVARPFIVSRVKEELSIPAPRIKLIDKDGNYYYVAGWLAGETRVKGEYQTGYQVKRVKGREVRVKVRYIRSPATPGAPPRKLSSRLRTSMTGLMINGNKTLVVGTKARGNPTRKYPLGFNYPKYHEIREPGQPRSGQHPFIVPTVRKWRKQIAQIVGREIQLVLR